MPGADCTPRPKGEYQANQNYNEGGYSADYSCYHFTSFLLLVFVCLFSHKSAQVMIPHAVAMQKTKMMNSITLIISL